MKAIRNDSKWNPIDRSGARSGGVEVAEHDRVYVAEGDVVAGKYRVERLLGVGGVGFVVAARHVDLGGTFALKFLKKRFLRDKSIVERFTREAKAACRIKSDHVARVYDVGLSNGAPFLVMEHLVGRDLASLIAEGGRLSIEEAVEYTVQACAALAVVHAHGVVHRDIKPENLFLVDHEGVGTIKLLDFGISKIVLAPERPAGEWGTEGDESLTGTLMFGSPYYMSPEHVRSSAMVDVRSDVWSLGVVLYELLTATTPFEGDSLADVCAAILEQEPRSLHEVSPEVPAELADVVGRCLQKDPAQRFGSVAELAIALLPLASPRALAVAEASPLIRRAAISTLGGMGEGNTPALRPSLLGSTGPVASSTSEGSRIRTSETELRSVLPRATPEPTVWRKRRWFFVAVGGAVAVSFAAAAIHQAVSRSAQRRASSAPTFSPPVVVQPEPAPNPRDERAPLAAPPPVHAAQPTRSEFPSSAPARPASPAYAARPVSATARPSVAPKVSASSSTPPPATSASTPAFLPPPQAPGRPDLGY